MLYLALLVVAVGGLLRGARESIARAAIAAAFVALVVHTLLYAAFLEAKRLAYERLRFTAALLTSLPWQMAEAEETQALMGDDPFAYGIARNRTNVETLVGHSYRQGLAPRRLAVEDMFVESLLDT